MTFINLEKAFVIVDWFLLLNTLKRRGIDWKDWRTVLKLYKDQATQIDINGIIKETEIKKGVRQGCSLSSYLFNQFIEEAIKKMREKTNDMKINGRQVHSIQLADDIALMEESEDNIWTPPMPYALISIMDKYHMKIDTTKTKTMTARRDQTHSSK